MKSYPGTYKTCNTIAKVDWLISHLQEAKEWAFDSETSGINFLTDTIFILSFSWKPKTGYAIDFRDFSDDEQKVIWDKLRNVFSNTSKKITQNGVFDIKFLWKKNVIVKNWYCDTILQAHLLDENSRHGLESITNTWIPELAGYHDELDEYVDSHNDCNPKKGKIEGDEWRNVKDAIKDGQKVLERGTYENIPREMIDWYASVDAAATFEAYLKMAIQIQKENLHWVLFNIQMPIQHVLALTEYRGVSVDLNYLAELRKDYDEKISDAWKKVMADPFIQKLEKEYQQKIIDKYEKSKRIQKAHTLTAYLEKYKKNWEFKASTKQLRELLIDKYGLKAIKFGKEHKKTKEIQPSMDMSVLDEYAKTVPICADIQTWRGKESIYNTFIKGMYAHIGPDKRVRSNYPLHRTTTGRPSSYAPNLNNIPRTAVEVKKQFVADSGCFLLESDLSQAEFRILAHYSNDQQMLHDINSGLDVHYIVAALGKGRILPDGEFTYEKYKAFIEGITKEERNIAKTIVFGIMYGRGAKSVSQELGISIEEAQNIIKLFFDRYPAAKRWLKNTEMIAERDCFVMNLYGRKRRLIYINQQEHPLQNKAKRQAVNAPIQSGASDTVFLSAIRIFKKMRQMQLKSRLVLTVYDSLIYNVPPDEIDIMCTLVREEMIKDTGYLKVALNCEVKIGKRWGELSEVHFDNGKPLFEKMKNYSQLFSQTT